jgi:hypothetical protein
MPEPFDWTRCPEADGPGQAAEDGQVVYNAPDPVRVRPVLSHAEAEAAFARAFPEYGGSSSPAVAAARGVEPDVIS